jgi:amino acid transporter
MTAEMSSLISDNGGYVLWAQVAFGDFVAWVSGLNGSIASIFDLALYPALFAQYSTLLFDLDSTSVSAPPVFGVLVWLGAHARPLCARRNISCEL